MSVLSTAALAAYLRVSDSTPGLQEALESAEAQVAAFLGTDNLADREVTETVVTRRNRSFLEVTRAPITSVTSLTVNGWECDVTTLTLSHWHYGHASGFPAYATVVITYRSGWSAGSMPAPVREAVLATAAASFNAPQGVTSERLGDVTVQYGPGGLPESARAMLAAFRRGMP